MTDAEREKQAWDRYHAAMHGCQSGVAYKMEFDRVDTSPKQLRVGVNSALMNVAALAHLLLDKGIITHVEYAEACAQWAEQECHVLEEALQAHYGHRTRIKLL